MNRTLPASKPRFAAFIMNRTLPASKPRFAAFITFLISVILPTSNFKTKMLLVLIPALFSFSSMFGQITDPPYNTPGPGTWTAPSGVTSVTVEVWGAGGGGTGVGVLSTNGKNSAGGGGSGGGFVKTTYAVTPGTTYNFNVGAGGSGPSGADGGVSWFFNATTVKAVGGKGAGAKISTDNYSGAGAIAPTSGNIGGTLISTYGGNGANGVAGTAAGGGGSSAGNTTGNSASGASGGVAPTNGDAGATAPGSNGTPGVPGVIGSGGSGAKKGNGGATPDGGNGGDGQIKITYTCPAYSAGSNQTLAACATTATLAATNVSSPATGVWTVVSGSGSVTTPTSATSGVTGIVPGTPLVLRWIVTNGGCGATFSDVTITSPVCLTYCASSYANGPGTIDGIVNVTLLTLNNTSTQNNISPYYTFYNALPKPDLQKSSSPTISIKYGSDPNQYGAVWIDFNQNGVFETSEGFVSTGNAGANGVSNITFTIPPGAVLGNTRMRVRGGNDSLLTTAQACGASSSPYGETEDYIVNIIDIAPCTGTPSAGTAILTPSTGIPSSSFVATITGSSTGSDLSYQWQIADALAGPYTDIATQTGASANLNAVPLPGTTKYYRRKTTCNSSGLSGFSGGVPFTTTTPTYCTPTSGSKMNLYISSFMFVGTLNDPPLTANVTGGDGYKDYTTLTPIAEQPDGSVINIEAISLGSVNSANGNWKAWVDWNGDGDFIDLGEEVYSLTDYFTNALTFGFIIPPGQTPGKYRLRIKVNYDGTTITPCSAFTNGEVEDYSFLVKYNCPVKVDAVNIIPADGHRCGTGTVNLSASGNGTNYKWYTTLTGGTAVFTGSNFTTSSLSTTTVYYVTAVNGTCESAYRIPVTARIDPEPVVNITVPAPICGTGFSGAQLTSSGDQYVDTIIDEKEFIEDATSLGLFEINTTFDTGYYTDGNGNWKNRPSPWIPPVGPYAGLSPALSSGYFGGNYAAIVTDISRTNSILNSLTLKTGKSLINFQDLMLDFDLYYFSITTDPLRGYLKIQYSMDNGGSWNTLETVTTIQGNPNVWAKKSYAIPGPYTATQFKIRFLLFSYADGTEGWKESIAAVDNIKVYGNKPITTGFVWSGPPSMLYDATCTTLIGSTPTNSICIKPTSTQIENDTNWSITATANFANGCPATKTIIVQNDTKTWDNAGNNWNTNNWKPGGAGVPPTGSKCVIVKTPLIIQTGSNGLAKNVRVESTGKLTIRPDASLTVTDQFINQASVNDVILESDSNLKQINDNPTPANSGSITARRNIKFRTSTTRDEYNYLISPVTGQSLKTLYPGVPTTSTYPYILYHNESNNFFYNSSGAYIPGRGLAVKEPSVAHVPANNKDAEFKGPLANGVITYPLAFTNSSLGYNLVGNPYASNIDLKALYTLNSANISSTFYFWDNGANNVYVQEGSNYKGRAYAVYNAVSDMGNEAGFILPTSAIIGTKKPNNIAKVAQGFMVKTNSGGKTLTFNNSVRTVDNTGVKFFSKGAASEANRYWLQLISPTNAVNTIGVVYFEEGSTAYGMDDSELNVSSSDMFYSLAEDHQLQIEGRPKFVNTDKIVLGSNYFATGNYTIALAENEGVFANGQNIYLKDKQTGIVTNLSQGAYTFAATAGASTGRFEIVYLPEAVLATDGTTKENLVVYKDGNNFVVKTQSKKITDLELFDAAGRLMRSFRPNSFKTIIPADQLLNGVYILKINQNGEITTKKVIR